MLATGLRELKNRLAEYVRRVRAGESVLITDRGAVVAELGPPGSQYPTRHPTLARLVREGEATVGAPNEASAYPVLPRLASDRLSARLIDAERGQR
jgi:antitoxin (DNA-binding transcriptional repressor) of toxin-antitoxin stability system